MSKSSKRAGPDPKSEGKSSKPRGGDRKDESGEFGRIPMLKPPDGTSMGNFDQFKRAFKAYCVGEFGEVAQVIETLEPYKPPGPTPPTAAGARSGQAHHHGTRRKPRTGSSNDPVEPDDQESAAEPDQGPDDVADAAPDEDAAPGLAPVPDEMAREIYAKELKVWVRVRREAHMHLQKMYGKLTAKLSRDSEARLSVQPAWQQITTDLNFLGLWKLVVRTQQSRNAQLTQMDALELRNKFAEVRQASTEGVGEFKELLERWVKKL